MRSVAKSGRNSMQKPACRRPESNCCPRCLSLNATVQHTGSGSACSRTIYVCELSCFSSRQISALYLETIPLFPMSLHVPFWYPACPQRRLDISMELHPSCVNLHQFVAVALLQSIVYGSALGFRRVLCHSLLSPNSMKLGFLSTTRTLRHAEGK